MYSQRFSHARPAAPGESVLPVAQRVDRRKHSVRASFIAFGSIAAVGAGMFTAASASTPGAAVLKVTAAANRSGAVALQGQQLAGAKYILVAAPTSMRVTTIKFYLDGKLVRTEKHAPWDLVGGTDAKAAPLNVDTLPIGAHTVEAVIAIGSQTQRLNGAFVTGTAPTPAPSGSPSVSPAPKPSPTPTVTQTVPSATPTAPAPTTTPSSTPTPSSTASKTPSPAPSTSPSGSPSQTPTTSPTATPTVSTSPTTPPTPIPPAGFNPATYNWASVGGPTSGLVSAGLSTGLTLNTAGQILTGVQTMVGAQVIAQATGSGMANCVIQDGFRANGNGVSVNHCTVGNGVTGAGSYTLANNFITSQGDGIDPTGAGYKLIQYNKIWRDGTRIGTKHEDGIQFWQGGNALISRNWISGWQTSAIMVKADLGPISNVTIDSNFLDNPT
ncbi:MAG: hypothetical protein QOJ62_2106, partial [Actinomycetota bacterium]|nr:hypothetical protein [Actinomycetota bacterium]